MDNVARGRATLMLAGLALALAACAGDAPSRTLDVNSYAHQVTDGTVALYWNCSRPAPGLLRVEGMASNPHSPSPAEDLEFHLYGVNAKGRSVSRARATTKADWIEINAPSPFTIDLKAKGGESRLDLVYSYMLLGGAGGGGPFGLGDERGGERQNITRDICPGLVP